MKPESKLGNTIKAAREKTKLTQADVAQKIGININYYARIERGEETPSLKTLRAIAKLLKIKGTDILLD